MVLSSVIVVPTSVSKDPNQDSIISTASSLDTVQPTPVVTSKPKYPCSTPWSGNEWRSNSMTAYKLHHFTVYRNVCVDVNVTVEDCQTWFWLSYFCETKTVVQTKCIVKSDNKTVGHRFKYESLHPKYGFFKPLSNHEEHYKNNIKIVWQLSAPEGSLVYLELTNLDLHTDEGEACSRDKIEIRTTACHEPIIICNSSIGVYSHPTASQNVQITFTTDSFGRASGFKGAYYYYPINSSNPFEDAQRKLRERKLNESLSSNSSRLSRLGSGSRGRRRRLATRHVQSGSSVKAQPINKEGELPYNKEHVHLKTQPLTSRRLTCIDRILRTENAEQFLNDAQCGKLAAFFESTGFYTP